MPVINDKVSMWIPNSHQDRQAALVNKAVREYDPDLGFGLNEATGQWCIFLKHGATEMAQNADLPILGFGTIPHPDDAVKRLYETDARRRGREIVDSIQRHNDAIQKEAEVKAQDASDATAEAYEWAFRKAGAAPVSKVYFTDNPKGE